MSKVHIYDTPEEMWEQLGQEVCDTNLRTRETLDDLYEKAMLEYKQESGFNARFLEAQKKKSQRFILSPAEVHLPKSEQEKFDQQYHDLGKDLELKILVGMCSVGQKYYFEGVNDGDLPISFGGEEYDDIASLVQGVKDELSNTYFWGTKLTSLFYTIRKEVPLISEEISNDPEAYMSEVTKGIEKEDFLPAEFKEPFVAALQDLAYCKDKIRGLTEEERAEFERLFYQENVSNP